MITRRVRILNLALILGSLAAVFPAAAKDETKIDIGPGPTTMTAAEAAIEADPDGGTRDGVILLEETDRDESSDSSNTVTYHVRAKILTTEGRGLADVVIPFNQADSKLKQWWGRTILPDGTLLQLAKDELEEQTIARTTWSDFSVLKGTLPGVVPGCVIDYGYTIQVTGFIPPPPIPLQRSWPIVSFRYRWAPWQGMIAAYTISRGEHVSAEVKQTGKAVLVEAHGAAPVLDEPLSPPANVVRAMLRLYYSDAVGSIDTYWDDQGKAIDRGASRFTGSESAGRKLLAQTGINPQGDLKVSLRELYNWIGENIVNTTLRTHEARQAAQADETSPESAKEVLAERHGSSSDLDLLFMGLARALGAKANLVMVTDRTENFWDPKIYSLNQFDGAIVGITAEDGTVDFVDPGSGLPYGHVPWWYSSIPGAMATGERMQQVMVRGSRPQQNVSVTTVTMSFDGGDEMAAVDWSRTCSGQAGYAESLRLRRRDAEERATRLRELCGENDDLEVLEAEAPGLLEAPGDLDLRCSTKRYGESPSEGADSFRVSLDGPWIEPLPDLTDESRTLPVILPYPRTDTTTITAAAPEGFEPGDAPPPITISSPVGGYSLLVVASPDGYSVARSLTLGFVRVDPADYPVLLEFLNRVRAADRTSLEFERTSPPR